jgi:hypothetical protein
MILIICKRKRFSHTGKQDFGVLFQKGGKERCVHDAVNSRKSSRKPEECTPEQIKECHWEAQDHPCESEKK